MLTVRRIIAIVLPMSIASLVSFLWWRKKKQALTAVSSDPSSQGKCHAPCLSAQCTEKSDLLCPAAGDHAVLESPDSKLLFDSGSPRYGKVIETVFVNDEVNMDFSCSPNMSYVNSGRTCSACKRKSSDCEDLNALVLSDDDAVTVLADESICVSSEQLTKSIPQKRRCGSSSDLNDSFIEFHCESVPASPLLKCASCKRKINDDKDSGVSGDGDADADVVVETREESIGCIDNYVEQEPDFAPFFSTESIPHEGRSTIRRGFPTEDDMSPRIAGVEAKTHYYSCVSQETVSCAAIEEVVTAEILHDSYGAPQSDWLTAQESLATQSIQKQASCDGDSAFAEDYSSDAVSTVDSLGTLMSPVLEDVIGEPPGSPHRSWFANSIEETGSSDWADICDSNFVAALSAASSCTLPNINGVPLSQLSINVDVKSAHGSSKSAQSPKKYSPKKMQSRPGKSKESKRDVAKEKNKSSNHSPRAKSKVSPKKSDSDLNWRDHEQPKVNKSRQGRARTSESSNHSSPEKTPTLKIPESFVNGASQPDSKVKLTHQFVFPDDQCGKLIGKAGKTITEYKHATGADIIVETDESGDPMKVVRISGTSAEIKRAVTIINKRFNNSLAKIGPVDLSYVEKEVRYETLPATDTVDVIVTAIIDAGHVVVQLYAGESFEKDVYKVKEELSRTYFPSNKEYIFPLDYPPAVGMYAVLFADGGWHRVQVEGIADEDYVIVRFLDTGGSGPALRHLLRQMTANLRRLASESGRCGCESSMETLPMRTERWAKFLEQCKRPEVLKHPFQGIDCCLADVASENEANSYSYDAIVLLEQLTTGCVLQATVKAIHNGMPYVDLVYQEPYSGQVVNINRHLVDYGMLVEVEG